MDTRKLEATRQFWDAYPCDGQTGLESRRQLRYRKEDWLPARLGRIAERHRFIVEIGCGQGTDALTLCSSMASGGRYLGLDYSEASLESARAAAEETASSLKVIPEFRQGNAEALDLETDSVECIYSMGVLHHTPDTEKSIAEILRVLKPGGRAYICLYSTWAPKVFLAHGLRYFQRGIDAATGREHSLLGLARRYSFEKYIGTALLECFGVPVLRSYTRPQMVQLFADFEIRELAACGRNLPSRLTFRNDFGNDQARLGVFYFIDAQKPGRREH